METNVAIDQSAELGLAVETILWQMAEMLCQPSSAR